MNECEMTQEEKEEYAKSLGYRSYDEYNLDMYNEDFRSQEMEERRPAYREDYGVKDSDFL